MRKSFILGALLIMFLMVTALTTNVYAGVFTAQVTEAGINDGTGETEIWLYRSDVTETKKFVAAIGEENKMLAVALTAMSSGMDVKVSVAWGSWGAPLVFIRLISAP